MIERSTQQVTFTCDTQGCGETDVLQPVPSVSAADAWLHRNGWKRQGRFLFCPFCAREQRLAA